MKTVFVTGACGFVGSHTAERFLREGWKVVALIRDALSPRFLPGGVETVVGDIRNGAAYQRAMAGSDAVVHIAGLTKARTAHDYHSTNGHGAAEVARVAQQACPGVPFVLVSSQAAAGPSLDGRPVRESDRPRPISWYGQSKLAGEAGLMENHRGPWIIVRPSVVYGPRDNGLLDLFKLAANGWCPVLAGGRRKVQAIYVADLAALLVKAAQRPDLAGRRGFAGSQTLSMGDIAARIAQLKQPAARLFPVPAVALKLAGVVESVREAVTGKSRPFNRDKAVEILQPNWLADCEPLMKDLSMTELKPFEQGLLETCQWYIRQGWLPASFNPARFPLES